VAKNLSAIKRTRKAEERRNRNRTLKTRIRTTVRRFEEVLSDGAVDSARAVLDEVAGALDKAAARGAVHRNVAARKKSRLMRRLNKAAGGAQE